MNSRVLLLVSLVLLIGASVLGYLAYQSTAEAQALAEAARKKAESSADEGRTAMVVLARPVRAFEVLAESDLSIEKVKFPLAGSAQSVEAWAGRTLMTDLPAGSPLVETHFSPGGQVARLLRPGERAVAIPVNDVVGGGGFLQPGDVVDIILFMEGDEGRRPSTQVVMRTVRVLSFGTELIPVPATSGQPAPADENQSGPSGGRFREAKTAVLAVAEPDVSRLMLANSLGELRLAIVPSEELRLAAVGGITIPVTEVPAAVTSPAPVSSVAPSIMLPSVATLPVSPRKTAVPEQRHYMTDSVLQLSAARAPTGAAAPLRPRTSVAQSPSVVIIRGLSSESK